MSAPAVPRLPFLAPWQRLAVGPDRIIFAHGGEAVTFEGRGAATLLPALLPLLDGTRTEEEIVAILGEPLRPAVEHALALLAEHGVLAEGPPLDPGLPAPFAAAALTHAASGGPESSPAAVRAQLAGADVRVVGAGAAAAEIGRLLRLSGVGVVEPSPWDPPTDLAVFAVVAPDPHERDRLPAWNEAALAAGRPWLQVLPPDGSVTAIGPLFVPKETCCYECYRRRRAANLDYPDEFWALERSPGRQPVAPALTAAVAGLAATLALRWLLYCDPFAAGVLAMLELGATVGLRTHVVYRVPRCPACSEAATLAPPLPWAEAP